MSPRLRSRARWLAEACGLVTRLQPLGASRLALTLALHPLDEEAASLKATIDAWERRALKAARRRLTRNAHEYRRVAAPLRLRPSLPEGSAELSMTGALTALADLPELQLSPDAPAPAQPLRALFAASPVILPAAGLAALEFRLLRLSPAN